MFISSDGFLSSGVTAADFIESDCREELVKSVKRGAMLGSSSSNRVGIGSRTLVEDFMTICETSLIVTGTKTQSCRVARRQLGLLPLEGCPCFSEPYPRRSLQTDWLGCPERNREVV